MSIAYYKNGTLHNNMIPTPYISGNYKTDEVDTLNTWTDGSRIYRKTFELENLIPNAEVVMSNSVLVDKILRSEICLSFIDANSDVWYSGSIIANNTLARVYRLGDHKPIIYITGNLQYTKAYITLWYTKYTSTP